jgi:glucose-6-phosphate-specific signal transduction histidine kinase
VEINHFVKEGKLGLLGMTERVVLLGGTYKVHSVPGKGTVIKVEVNYPSKMKITELSERGLEQAGFLKKT